MKFLPGNFTKFHLKDYFPPMYVFSFLSTNCKARSVTSSSCS